jgi:hypothetical protein
MERIQMSIKDLSRLDVLTQIKEGHFITIPPSSGASGKKMICSKFFIFLMQSC